jgi:hypothetical protein
MDNALVVSGCLGNRCDGFRGPDRFGVGTDPRWRWRPWWRGLQWRRGSTKYGGRGTTEHGGRGTSFDAHVATCTADAYEQTLVWEFEAAISPSRPIGNARQYESPEREHGLEHVSTDARQYPTSEFRIWNWQQHQFKSTESRRRDAHNTTGPRWNQPRRNQRWRRWLEHTSLDACG